MIYYQKRLPRGEIYAESDEEGTGMAVYILFSLACAVLALVYLNRNQGSRRLYPSIGAVLAFLFCMWAVSLERGYGAEAAVAAGGASVVGGVLAYWMVLLAQWLWKHGAVGKIAALIGCIFLWYLALPVWALGTAVRRIFRSQFAAADAAAAEREAERLRRAEETIRLREEKKKEKRLREEALLEQVHSDDELCLLFARMYRRMGYAPTVERVGEDGPLRMFLDCDGVTFSFVAIARRELLDRDSVEWAASFRGQAQRAGLVTAGTFTAGAARLAKRRRVALVDRPNLPRFERAACRAELRRAFGEREDAGGTEPPA